MKLLGIGLSITEVKKINLKCQLELLEGKDPCNQPQKVGTLLNHIKLKSYTFYTERDIHLVVAIIECDS